MFRTRYGSVLAVVLAGVLSSGPALAAKYAMGITDRVIYAPALVAQELGFWKDVELEVGVGLRTDDADLFKGVRARFNHSGRHCTDLGACRAGDLAYQQAVGLGIVPVAEIAVDSGHTKLVVRERIAEVVELKGAAVACDLETGNLVFLKRVLQEAALTLADVRIADLHGSENPRLFLQETVDAIVIGGAGAAACVAAGGRIAASTSDYPGTVRHVLFAKEWIRERNPEVVKAFVEGCQRAQDWVRDPANTEQYAAILSKHYYWLRYKYDAPPLGVDFVEAQTAGYELRETIAPGDTFEQHMADLTALFEARVAAVHNGDARRDGEPLARPTTGTALDEAVAWWRFAGPADYRNYGTAGSALDLRARGAETRRNLYGVHQWDYYHPGRIWEFGGYLNDGYGWATDGIAKYCALDAEQAATLDFSGSFTIWLRVSNRNTKNTVLLGSGPYDSDAGFSVHYARGEPPGVFFMTHPSREETTLRLDDLPLQTFLDICFSYDARDGALQAWVHETRTGKLVAARTLRIPPGTIRQATAPLSIGGNLEHNTNHPLHGNIESVAVWDRPLRPAEVRALTTGPAREPRTTSGLLTEHVHNVRDYGALGDGKTDDTDAIQAAIDACVFPVTIKDPRSGRWWGLPDRPPKPGHGRGGLVYIPSGMYRTTRPLVVRAGTTVKGDEAMRPVIDSEAEAGIVWWPGDWDDRQIDFKGRFGPDWTCSGVRLENLWVRAERFAGHTMGVPANSLRMRRCRWEGGEAGFVCTGFMMFSEIRDCQFESLWILTRQGARFNTSIVENILVGLHGTHRAGWAIRLEGCIQCVRLSEIVFEVRGRGLLLDSYAAGVTIDIENVWNYDVYGLDKRGQGSAEVLRVVNGSGISVRNVMALDHPSTLFIGKNVRNIKLENVLAKSITVEDAAATRPIFSNVPTAKLGDRESMIEDEMGGTKPTPDGN